VCPFVFHFALGALHFWQGALFKHMVLKCRAKADVNPKDGETRVRCHVLSAYPANYASESKSLLDEISTYDGAADVAMVA